jgi:hypothetical protein
VVVSLELGAPVPLLLLGVRDEFAGRAWRPPGPHWPGVPVLGGLDLQAGGTWLAVHRDVPLAACVLNGRGLPAPAGARRSRGELPLRAASGGHDALLAELADPAVRARYDPFHLLSASPSSAILASWDGSKLATADLEPGTHVVMNGGHAYSSTGSVPVAEPRAAHFGPRFAAARPPGEASAPLDRAWGGWLGLAAGDGLPVTDPRSLIARRELADGRVWGSTSMSLVALAPRAARYDFQAVDVRGASPVPSPWHPVLT